MFIVILYHFMNPRSFQERYLESTEQEYILLNRESVYGIETVLLFTEVN